MLLPHHAMNVRVTFDRQWSALRVSSDERLYWGIVGADAEDKAIQGATAILSAFTAQQQAAMETFVAATMRRRLPKDVLGLIKSIFVRLVHERPSAAEPDRYEWFPRLQPNLCGFPGMEWRNLTPVLGKRVKLVETWVRVVYWRVRSSPEIAQCVDDWRVAVDYDHPVLLMVHDLVGIFVQAISLVCADVVAVAQYKMPSGPSQKAGLMWMLVHLASRSAELVDWSRERLQQNFPEDICDSMLERLPSFHAVVASVFVQLSTDTAVQCEKHVRRLML